MSPSTDGDTTVLQLREAVRRFVDERDWRKYHNAKDIAISICIEASELLETFQWVPEREIGVVLADARKSTRVREELADVLILCLSLANAIGVDIAKVVSEKVAKNECRLLG